MVRTLPCPSQAVRGGRLPDFLLVGAPKAGTTALHAALAGHPELFLSGVKEPKYYLCGDSPPPAYQGPGDAHSNQEWIWQRQRYLDLFDERRRRRSWRGESTPFYLYHRDARRRIAADLPRAKLIAVLRDPVDRAYSNWMHLWADGLEPCADVVEACAARGSSGSTPAGRRSGTTGVWACTAGSSPTSSSTSRASRCCCCATATWSTTRPTR